MKILGWLASLFTSGAHGAVGAGNAVVNAATIAALSPAVIWLVANKDETVLQFTVSYGELAVASAFFAGLIKLAHVLRRGSPADRNGI